MGKNKTFLKVGDKVGRLTIIEKVKSEPNKGITWLCKCDCGNLTETRTALMNNCNTLSCGCIREELRRKNFLTHGFCVDKSSEYNAWNNMKQRCYNPNNDHYKNYGARGIIVCDRWLNSFPDFLSDMGKKPTPDHSIERDNVNGNYEPSNCYWGTDFIQSRNRTDNKKYTYNGITKVAVDWEVHFGVYRGFLNHHIGLGKSFEEILKEYNYVV